MIVDGSVAVVTGGAGGIGSAVAQRLLEAGGSVVVTDLNADRVDDVVTRLEAVGPGRVAGIAGDCASTDHIARTLELAEERFGEVDLYAANAGVGLGVALQATEDDWATSWSVNLMAHVRAAELLVPRWIERGSGYFLSTASAAGLLTQIGSATYSVTKHAAVAFAEWLSITYGDRGIKVSCLCPMGVNTAMLDGGPAAADNAEAQRGSEAVKKAGAVLEPLDVADAVLKAVADERFLVLPHPEVLEFFRRKGSDYDRWLAGMRRYQESLG